MPRAPSNGIEIEYESFGREADPVILLIMGLGAQLTRWPVAFAERLAGKGFRVIRFDNRDVGLSTKLDAAGAPDFPAIMQKTGKPAYTLTDMAADAVGLLDALSVSKAHIIGASMGGMIAQLVAVNYPERVLSLTSIMSTTGNPALPRSTPEAGAVLMQRPPEGADLDALVEHGMKAARVVGSPGFPFDEADQRARLRADIERSTYPVGFARQMAAVMADGDRRERLKTITAPTVVLHGADDPLVPVQGGEDTAASIPGAELRIIPGMGHDLPPGVHDATIEAILAAVARV